METVYLLLILTLASLNALQKPIQIAVDFRPFKYDFTNFTLLRIVDFSRPFVQYSLHSIVREEIMMGRTLDFTEFSGGLDTEAALIYDAVHLLAVALSQVRQVQDLQPASIHCERLHDRPEEDDRDPGHKQFWQHGSTIINFMRLSTIPGLSGTVKFDSWGRRSEFSLDLLNLFEEQGLARVGGWEIEGGVTLSGLPVEGAGSNEPQNPMMNKSLVVTTILNPPYTMIKEESGVLFGNDRYEGFIPEMVDIMSKILQFNVSLRIVADGQYGGFDGSRWNGMMREVLVGEADMAVADLSITTKRADAVEFSMPWMNLGISIIYMKPKKAPPGLLMFLEPFGIDVWIATLISILLVAMFTFVIGRFSPYEWFNPNFCIMAPDELETQWNLNNSLWHTVGALMQQGTDFCPVSLSARFLVGIFYFFTLILLSSYTANLAASLTAETLNRPITSAEDLAEQTQIKYGVVFCGSTCSFFRDSSYETYMKMWSFMSSPENLDKVMVKSNAEGVEKVQQEQGGFAFMMESAGIQYIVERNCELAQVGGNLDTKGYGIATRPGSGFKTLLDQAILTMQENGDLHRLKNKWWKQKRGGGRCATTKAKGAEELGLDNLGGIFVVTFSGVAFACLACLAELLYVTYQDSEELGTSWWYELRSRTSFAFRCTAFGRKERMPAVRAMRRTSESEGGESKGESSSEEETSMSRPKRNSWHLHYPGW